ncbi:MAG: entericidin A/B family lipoprotein [Thermodesulfovibrionales bacterium]
MKKVLLAVAAAICIAAFAGCNTVGGMGKDIRSGGDAIEKASGTKNQ